VISQEIETYYLIPAIRRELVKLMLEKGENQKKIADILHLTKSAVSQYLSGKRGKQFILSKELVKDTCENIMKGNNYLTEIQKLIQKLKSERKICKIYTENSIIPEDCEVCKNVCLS